MSDTIQAVLLWVVALAVLVIAGIIVAKTLTWGEEYDPEQVACAEQIKANARMATWTKGELAGRIDCPTRHWTAEGSDEEVQHALAQDMVDCYDLWGNGELLLFDQDGVYCHVCSVVTFEDSSSLKGFSQFLYEENYLEQLLPSTKNQGLYDQYENFGADSANVIDRSQPYATIFFYTRGDDLLDDSLETITGGAGGFLVGSGLVAASGIGMLCLSSVVCAVGVSVVSVTGGALFSTLFPETPDYASFVTLQPWTPETVRTLGCQLSTDGKS